MLEGKPEMEGMVSPLITQMLSGVGDIWLAVAYVAGMFLVVTFRPQQIGSLIAFRASYFLFAAYLLVLPMANLIMYVIMSDQPGRRGPNLAAMIGMQFGVLLARGLFALSLVTALTALVPGERNLSGDVPTKF
jgi:hypothetical protein